MFPQENEMLAIVVKRYEDNKEVEMKGGLL